ncbi:MAG TPA: hypothetical protein PKV70_08750 [Thermodesulfobacteriota bacterium]|nr:hypothetical protein [Thermodesulfobacteriota bacterium]HQU14323.1 hypothetical protein [Thermodesulfobacteriota bacterium]
MSVISREKVEALAKRGHVKCHGRGILGWRPVTGAAVLCSCVIRNLRRKGVNTDRQADVARALAPDPPNATGEVPCPVQAT